MKTTPITLRPLAVLLLTVTLSGWQACNKTGVDPYEGEASVYFELADKWETMPDSLVYTFYSRGEQTAAKKTVELRVSLLGNPVSYDRQVAVELDSALSADENAARPGVHFEPLPATVTLPAEAFETVIPVTFLYTEELDTREKKLGIYLRANDDFSLKLPGRDHIRLHISNMAIRPVYWGNNTSLPFTHFGAYSAVKQRTIEEVLEVFFPTPKKSTGARATSGRYGALT
ncbi:MAG: DUF4843 domain-containing protein [Rikenellaceae bacterium]|nr:DUF4843 domain-containing protein [Rikenellaceae bacterium]